jgi:DNA-binding SARP family transcriptional activator
MIDRDSPSVLVRVWLLGAFHAERRQDHKTWKTIEKSALGNSYARSLLKYLLCVNKRKASRSDIIDDLWPERELHLAEKYLNNASSRLYRVLPDEGILTPFGSHGRTGYELAGQELLWTDIDECEALLSEAERLGRTSSQALPLLEQASRHFERGSMLEGESAQWSLASRAEKDAVMRCCLLWLAEAYEAQGMLWHVRRQYHTLLETNPLDEDILCRLLAMLHRQGMIHDARTTFEKVKHRFKARDRAEFKKALDDINEAIKLAVQLQNAELLASSLYRRAKVRAKQQHYDRAVRDLEEALPYANRSRDPLRCYICMFLAEVYSLLDPTSPGLLLKSLELLDEVDKAVRMYSVLEGDGSFVKVDVSGLYMIRGDVLRRSGEIKEAQKALFIVQESLPKEFIRWKGNLYLSEAQLALADGDINSSCKLAYDALDFIEATRSRSNKAEVLSLYQNIWKVEPSHPRLKDLGARLSIA